LDLEDLRWNELAIKETIDMDRLNSFEDKANSNALSERMAILKEFSHVGI